MNRQFLIGQRRRRTPCREEEGEGRLGEEGGGDATLYRGAMWRRALASEDEPSRLNGSWRRQWG